MVALGSSVEHPQWPPAATRLAQLSMKLGSRPRITMIDPHRVESMATTLACEDAFGIWELLWTLDLYYPDVHRDARLEAAIGAIAHLAESGLIEVFKVKGNAGPDLDEDPLPLSQIAPALADPNNWDPDSPTEHAYWFASTPAGQVALDAGRCTDEGY